LYVKKQESMPLVISNRVFAMVIDGPLQGKHFRSYPVSTLFLPTITTFVHKPINVPSFLTTQCIVGNFVLLMNISEILFTWR